MVKNLSFFFSVLDLICKRQLNSHVELALYNYLSFVGHDTRKVIDDVFRFLDSHVHNAEGIPAVHDHCTSAPTL